MERLAVVEILSPRGVPLARIGVGRTFRIGRGYGCDVMLDDPYADAVHLEGSVTEDGAFEVRDVSSVNPATLNGAPMGSEPRRVDDGARLTVGATPVRLRHAATPVPAALPLGASPREAGGSRGATGAVAWLLAVGASVVIAVGAWLTTPIDHGAAEAAATLVVGFFMLLGWAGAWALGTRVATGRFRFAGHLAMASAVLIALFPINHAVSALSFAAGPGFQFAHAILTAIAVAWGTLYLHARVASSASRRKVAAITGGIVLMLGGAAYVLGATVEDPTGDVTASLMELRAFPDGLVSAEAPADYLEGLDGLVDELADMEP